MRLIIVCMSIPYFPLSSFDAYGFIETSDSNIISMGCISHYHFILYGSQRDVEMQICWVWVCGI